jgi:hypothetical protein
VNRLEIPQAEVEDFWIKQITPSSATRVLVARSTVNRFEGEPVALDLAFYPNPIVFQQGDIIAEGRVDGRNSDISVFGEIRDFVRIYVNAKAKRVKMIRDGFTIPKDEYQVLEALKLRAGSLGTPSKKSELLRAGIKALVAMPDAGLLAALHAVPAIKTGRPGKD